VEIDLPGVAPEDIRVVVTERKPTVNGQRSATPPEGLLFQQCERPTGSFQRVLTFPQALDPQATRASYRLGTCRIYLPKKSQPDEQVKQCGRGAVAERLVRLCDGRCVFVDGVVQQGYNGCRRSVELTIMEIKSSGHMRTRAASRGREGRRLNTALAW